MKKGILITFEGPEGSGKSTHAKLLCNYLREKGRKCLLTREPGGTEIGELIRRILLDCGHRRISPVTEALLFEASRSALTEDIIRPHLKKGYVVLCDRFSDATVVYQGYAARGDIRALKRINRYSTGGLKPDMTVLLDIPESEGRRRLKRRAAGLDRMERKSSSYHRAVRRGYKSLARSEKSRFKVIKADKDINVTQARIREVVYGFFQAKSR